MTAHLRRGRLLVCALLFNALSFDACDCFRAQSHLLTAYRGRVFARPLLGGAFGGGGGAHATLFELAELDDIFREQRGAG